MSLFKDTYYSHQDAYSDDKTILTETSTWRICFWNLPHAAISAPDRPTSLDVDLGNTIIMLYPIYVSLLSKQIRSMNRHQLRYWTSLTACIYFAYAHSSIFRNSSQASTKTNVPTQTYVTNFSCFLIFSTISFIKVVILFGTYEHLLPSFTSRYTLHEAYWWESSTVGHQNRSPRLQCLHLTLGVGVHVIYFYRKPKPPHLETSCFYDVTRKDRRGISKFLLMVERNQDIGQRRVFHVIHGSFLYVGFFQFSSLKASSSFVNSFVLDYLTRNWWAEQRKSL